MNVLLFSQQATIQCAPKKPKLEASADCHDVFLKWTHDGKNTIDFRIYKNGNLLATLDEYAREWTDSDVKQGKAYYYAIEAYGRYGTSPKDYAEITVPTCPGEDCRDLEPSWFNGTIVEYIDPETGKLKYYVSLDWEIEGKGSPGEWELLKSSYKIDKETGQIIDAWAHELKVMNTPFFDGRITSHYYPDYNVSKNTIQNYVLRWRCGYCKNWRYFGPVQVWIPKK